MLVVWAGLTIEAGLSRVDSKLMVLVEGRQTEAIVETRRPIEVRNMPSVKLTKTVNGTEFEFCCPKMQGETNQEWMKRCLAEFKEWCEALEG